MTTAQTIFVGAFLLVNALVIGAFVLVFNRARIAHGGGKVRLGRLPSERYNEGNRWASYLHRLTGVGVLLFLGMHVLDVSLFAVSASLYDEVHELYSTTILRIFECALLF